MIIGAGSREHSIQDLIEIRTNMLAGSNAAWRDGSAVNVSVFNGIVTAL